MIKKNWLIFAVLVLLMLSCSPNFNWREFRFSDDELTFMLPCKPQEQSKDVEIAHEKQTLTMAGCSVGELNFTIGRLKPPSHLSQMETIELWQKASWYSASGSEPHEALLPKKVEIKINNKTRAAQELSYDKTIKVHWQWFQEGPWIYQLGVYAQKAKPQDSLSKEGYEMFFNSAQ